jgi:hypothetical protein
VGFDSQWPKRKREHISDALNTKSLGYHTVFHRAIRKYGFESFEWNVLYQSRDRDFTLNEMERHFIMEYNTFTRFNNCNGYNLTLGGEGSLGCKWGEDSKNKLSVAKRGKLTKRSRKISTPFGTFDAIMIASTELGLNADIVRYRLKCVSYPDWYYLDGKTLKIVSTPTLQGIRSEICTPYGVFGSIHQCSKEIGIPKYIVRRKVTSTIHLDWFYTGVGVATQKPIITPFGRFSSLAEASRQLNINVKTIAARVQSKRNVDWQYQ